MDWAYENATAIIAACSALLSALVAGGFAVLGAWLSNRQNRQHQKQQLEHETIKEARKNLADKGEELYVSLSKWGKAISNYQIFQMKIALGELTTEQVNQLVIDYKIEYNADRMTCLMKIYFKEIGPAYDKVLEARDLGAKVAIAHEKGTISAQECLKGINQAGKRFNHSLDELLKNLGEVITKKIE